MPILPTVSRALIGDWLGAIAAIAPPAQARGFLQGAGLAPAASPATRVTHDQIVRLYQLAATGSGDEMMGLWSRPIRSGALKHLCASVRGASSLGAALYRFTTFWNLLLDDHRLALEGPGLTVALRPSGDAPPAPPNRFGQALMLKLAHGIASWLAGRELPVEAVGLPFPRPPFAADYAVLFPAPVAFDAPCAFLRLSAEFAPLPAARTDAEMRAFLERAPRDWIFTSFREHALPLRVRELVQLSPGLSLPLPAAAAALHLTPRTLMRRLDAEGTSFQAIRDGLRRDIALRDLAQGGRSIEAIAQELGFASAATFHRAFRRWTGTTPGTVRRGAKS
ncbi:AraC family transcriptional regulator [Rhodovulum sp. DZ06]|uniref:AraC family transcriptional regulator n=1 Tax=Rhodovulum sp. DZ06 TaxID=3425126 RepID=UPI003D330814